MPTRFTEVIGFIEDASVAIHDLPAVVWNSGTNDEPQWWSGVPAQYIDLTDSDWTVTHWMPISSESETPE